MPAKVYQIQSILGGHAPTSNFASENQFQTSLGIDPSLPLNDGGGVNGSESSGLIRPTALANDGGNFDNIPLWNIQNPKNSLLYVYDAQGSVYSWDEPGGTAITRISDGGSMSNSSGNGAAYYDNYVYLSKNTTVARYGPLNGSPAFDGDYWGLTLGKAALTNTTYPSTFYLSLKLPNHVLHRHSDGRLYIADVVGNQGTLHFIQTAKTTVEGDTDNGSTFSKLQVGYGLWPTAMESYGSDLVIAFTEFKPPNVTGTSPMRLRAKLAFWDTTSQNVNKITWVEFPDGIITAMKNVNGILKVFSGPAEGQGCRVTEFVGGYSFKEVAYLPQNPSPLAGAVDGSADRVVFGTHSYTPEEYGSVYSVGLQKRISNGVFNILAAPTSNSATLITALSLINNTGHGLLADHPFVSWTTGATGTANNSYGYPANSVFYGTSPSNFWDKKVKVGQPFKLTKIIIPLTKVVSSGMILTPKIYTDDGIGTTYTYQTINNTNYSGAKSIVLRSDVNGVAPTGDHNFWLELRSTGTTLLAPSLPITFEYEIIPQ